MSNCWKRLAAFAAASSMVFSLTPGVFADELPHAFWAPDDAYLAALNAGDDAGIINFGLEALNVIRPLPDSEQKANIMASRLDQIGLAYERLGQYTNALTCYQEYIPYAQQLNWADGVKIAEAKVLHYTPVLDLYTKSYDPQVQYGAKHEPQTGVLYGTNMDGGLQSSLPQESITLVYLEFGSSDMHYVEQALNTAAENSTAVEIAWNMPGEGSQIGSAASQTDHISALTSLIAQYPNAKVFVRFAAEPNVWTNRADPAVYIEAFRTVASAVKAQCPNAAMVWDVAQASSWDINMNDYYPGDDVVDWVGVSLYMQKHFLGQVTAEDEAFQELTFFTGQGADPVLALREVVETYGSRKPIMLAESGVSHLTTTLNENTEEWAKPVMRKMMKEIPMVYPQVKAMLYFDRYISGETNDYSVSGTPALKQQYLEAVQDEQFCQAGSALTPASYQKAGDWIPVYGDAFSFRAHAHTFGTAEPTLNLFIDGTWVGSSSSVPYECTLDMTPYASGNHTLRVVANDAAGNQLAAREYTLALQPEIKITVNGRQIETDVAPVLQNDRTLVPIRVVSDELGAGVTWDEATKTVTVSKDGTILTLQIANKTMSVSNGSSVTLDVPPQTVFDRTLVPLRAVSDGLGASVNWNGETNTVEITQN